MRVFWWQGGLQIQPDSEVETEAILILLGNLRYEAPLESNEPRTAADPELRHVERGLDLDL